MPNAALEPPLESGLAEASRSRQRRLYDDISAYAVQCSLDRAGPDRS